MGFLPLQILAACSYVRCSKVKILKVDGEWIKYDAPISVKQVLLKHPGHSLFSATMVKKLGNKAARPLQGTVNLQPGHLYFLIPASSKSSFFSTLVASNVRTSASRPSSFPSIQAPHQSLHCSSIQETKVAFMDPADETSTSSADHIPSISTKPWRHSQETLPSPTHGVLRLKIVVSKQQLASILLKAGSDTTSLVKDLLQLESRAAPIVTDHELNHIPINPSAWKPTLQSIPESY